MKLPSTIKSFSVSRPKNSVADLTASVESQRRAKGLPTLYDHTRFVILVLSTLCLSALQSNVLTLNFTVICMGGSPDNSTVNETSSSANQSFIESVKELEADIVASRYNYTPGQRSMLFSIVAVGAVVAVWPMMQCVTMFGTRVVTSAFGLISCVSTALIPLAAYGGYGWLIACRFMQGTGLSVAFTFIGVFTHKWSMAKQNAFFIAFLTCFFQFGPIFTMPVAGALCTSSLGWPSVYYLHAIITAVLFTLFVYFYRELPSRHKMVSSKELERIRRLKSNCEGARDPVPYKAIFLSPSVWSIWVSGFGNFMGIQLTMQFTPTYLNRLMGFSVESTGVLSSIPQIVTFIVKMTAGIVADKSTVCCNPTISTKIFNTIGIGGMGLLFLGQAFITSPCAMRTDARVCRFRDQPIVALIVLICSTSIIGLNCGAFFRGSAIMAVQHNHFIMSVQSLLNCASALLTPVVVNAFVSHDTFEEWRSVWFFYFGLLTICNIAYCVFGRAVPAEWTKKTDTVSSCLAAFTIFFPFLPCLSRQRVAVSPCDTSCQVTVTSADICMQNNAEPDP